MIFFLNYIAPENLDFNTRNIASILKGNGFIQGTVSVIFYKPKAMLPFSKKCSSVEAQEATDVSKISEITF